MIALLLLNTFSWSWAALWYDEAMTLEFFVLPANGLGDIFRNYSHANNHFLATALEWLWLNYLPVPLNNEYLLRVPSLACGAATLAVILCGWRRYLGDRWTLAAALLLALSPVYAPFVYQLRGYSLAMLLATIAATAARAREERDTPWNAAGLFTASLLLPLVMPSAAMAPCAIAVGLAAQAFFSERGSHSLRRALARCWPAVSGALIGTGYYLTLWEEFTRASRESGGWNSAWLVAGNVLLAFALHLGVLTAAVAGALRARFAKTKAADSRLTPEINGALWQLAGVALALTAVLALPSPVQRSPFPRVFIVLLPIVTLAAARLKSFVPKLNALSTPRLLLSFAAPAAVILLACNFLTALPVFWRNTPPQNLLLQYYRNDSSSRNAVEWQIGRTADEKAHSVFIVDAIQVMPFCYYWQLAGEPMELPGGARSVLPSNLLKPAMGNLYRSRGILPVCLARTEAEARVMLADAGFNPMMPLLPLPLAESHWRLWRGAI